MLPSFPTGAFETVLVKAHPVQMAYRKRYFVDSITPWTSWIGLYHAANTLYFCI